MKKLLTKIFMLGCLVTVVAISQNAYSQQPCNGKGWTEKIIYVGEPNTFVDFLAGSVTLDITDGNGKSTSTGSYLQIRNYGDQSIEWVTYGNSPYYPVSPGGKDEKFLPIYRTKNDLTPTKVTVVIHYCGNTKATYPSPTGNSQSLNNQSQQSNSQSTGQSGSSKSAKEIIVGCWRFFPNGGTEDELRLQMDDKFTADGKIISLQTKAGDNVSPPEDYILRQERVYSISGNKLSIVNKTADPSSLYPIIYEFAGEKFFLLDDEGKRTKAYSIKITCGEPFK